MSPVLPLRECYVESGFARTEIARPCSDLGVVVCLWQYRLRVLRPTNKLFLRGWYADGQSTVRRRGSSRVPVSADCGRAHGTNASPTAT